MRLRSLLTFALVTSVGLCAAPSFGDAKDKPVDKKHAAAGPARDKGDFGRADKKAAREADDETPDQQLMHRLKRLEQEVADLRKEVAALRHKGGGDAGAKFEKHPGGFDKAAKKGEPQPDKAAAMKKAAAGGEGDKHVKPQAKVPDGKPFKKEGKSPEAKHEKLKGKENVKENPKENPKNKKGKPAEDGVSARDEKTAKQPAAEKSHAKEGAAKGKGPQKGDGVGKGEGKAAGAEKSAVKEGKKQKGDQ